MEVFWFVLGFAVTTSVILVTEKVIYLFQSAHLV